MDFVNDHSGRHLLRIKTLLEVPDFVKESNVSADCTATLAPHQFADPVHREFPIDTPGHVFLSYAYVKSARVNQPRVLGNIRLAAEKLGIVESLKPVDAAFDAQEKRATERRFAVRLDFGEGKPAASQTWTKQGGVWGAYPIDTDEELRESAVKLANDRARLPLDCFVGGCRNIVKRAAELNLPGRELPRRVTEYGTLRRPSSECLSWQADARERLTGDPFYREIAKSASVNTEDRSWDDFRRLWQDTDELNGVKYARSVLDPHQIFNSGVAEADYQNELEKWALLNGAAVPVEAVAGMNEARVRRAMPAVEADKVAAIVKEAVALGGAEVSHRLSQLTAGIQSTLLRLLAA